ncbi:NAD(P)-dependent glycerol-3-phosphate dehydrogenase [Lichenibacterium minor]|uniref:Glycerol-3-phosphate dehydrogenase [NAD(P)+] n=1 Tax=Lichenibacterium minor TaxID=2316528 RepID=A0A4Q2U6R1_9HYPH|nr:NAD(P)H-dependent glycerol-3-phosphate dehydrogenase [Lichenibacterium minor]RYC30555.1 NAD(P)-dependent glycerol-3-phosphate dehydrogenase [Lichenibacterium minor]
MRFARIAVLGAGAWGTALATVAARPGRRVILWTRDPAEAAAMAEARENRRSLPGVRLANGIVPTASHEELATTELVLLAVPAQHLRATLDAVPRFAAGVPAVLCAKGIEAGTGLLMSDVLGACRPGHPAVALSGPSFAADVGQGRPTAVTVASEDGELARAVAEALAKPGFRPYHSTDLRGVEIGGAAKNVLAIACGVAAGMDLGASASAALIARGFAELGRFGRASGARPETLMGLSGLGDLVLTCSSAQSRNFAFGRALGAGASLAEAAGGKLAEGVATAPVLVRLARERGVDMPVAEAVAALVAGRTTPRDALDALMSRPSRAEAGD